MCNIFLVSCVQRQRKIKENKTAYAGVGKMITANSLSAGNHKVTIYEKSRYGDIIGGVERI